MAFLPQPILPWRDRNTTTHSINIKTRVSHPGAISVNRRRLYGVPAGNASTSPSSTTVCSARNRAEIRRELLRRIQERNEALRQSNEKSATAFQHELEALRSTSSPKPQPITPNNINDPLLQQLDPTHELPAYEQPDLLQEAVRREMLPASKLNAETAKTSELEKETESDLPNPFSDLYAPPKQASDSGQRGRADAPKPHDPSSSSTTVNTHVRNGVPELYSPPEQKRSEPLRNGVSELYSPPAEKPSESVRNGVSELYSPPAEKPSESVFEQAVSRISETVETLYDEAKDTISDVMESFVPKQKKEVADSAPDVSPRNSKELVSENTSQVVSSTSSEVASKNTSEVISKSTSQGTSNTSSTENVEDTKGRSFGKVILDAIVEGVPSPPSEEKAAPIDKTDIIHLVDTGKIKNLTVTKLRRLLSANKLKTSGRKAELIARLTSYAKQ